LFVLFSYSLYSDEKSDQDLSLLEALQQFYERNEGLQEEPKLTKEKEPITEAEDSLRYLLEALQDEKVSSKEEKQTA
jgi:hypothetical protein